jgi:CDP-diacylglycerol--serine O-phosphatidyltransferase
VLLYIVYLKGFMASPARSSRRLRALRRFAPGPFQRRPRDRPLPGDSDSAAGLFVASFVIAGVHLPPWITMALLAATGALMISSVPYGNLKGIKKGQGDRKKFLLLTSLMVAIFVFLRSAALAAISIYVISDWSVSMGKVAFPSGRRFRRNARGRDGRRSLGFEQPVPGTG